MTINGALATGLRRRKDCTVAESYYAARSRRDPEWRLRAIAAAAERYRRAKDTDPDRVLAYSGAYRARLRESSLTFPELHRRVGGDPELLRIVLADEVRRGTVERVQRRYRLNGGLPDDVKLALRDLGLSP